MDVITTIADPDAASRALLAASLALCAASLAVTGLCLAYVAKTVKGWTVAAWGKGPSE
jgi:hypothetical protein